MEIIKVKNYKEFAQMLRKKTGCEVLIKVMDTHAKHVHYQLNKDGMSLGVLCVDDGDPSFAPFCTLQNDSSVESYISVKYMPLMDDFIKVLKVFDEMFVD